MARGSQTLKLVDEPNPDVSLGPADVDLPSPPSPYTLNDGALEIEHGDGSVTIDFAPNMANPEKKESDEDDFYANLADDLADGELETIASDLLQGIEQDIQSRKDWLDMRERGISLLGLKIEEPTSSETSGAVEGMSRIRHPILLDATIRFQATARAELLPASGPVKVRNDATIGPAPARPLAQAPEPVPGDARPPVPGVMQQPPNPAMGHNGGPPIAMDTPVDKDEQAMALEKDMNHYLTVTATEYVPDTDRMLFYIGFGGDGFKKVFNCPLRRRPVSESVDAEDLIVSNASTDLKNCGRVTHRIKMRKSVLKRMQILGAYRDVELGEPSPAQPDAVEQKKAEIQGQSVKLARTQDQDYTIYEVYCELDLDQFAPKKFKGQGLPLPYRVTIEKDSRKILSVIRNWNKDDDEALAKQFFVQFPFIRGLGFYGLGFIHILGNITIALTAAWREMIDKGMYANFPGFIHDKRFARQLTNQFRIPPGGGVGVDLAPGQRLQDAIMPVPYSDIGAGFQAFIQHMEEVSNKLAMSAEVNVGEGKQDAPVGTTLALIEQATKIMDSAHKRLHAAQQEEFGLLKERFKEDPEAFWRHNKSPTLPWKKEQFIAAINSNELVPVADPNNPTSMHRVAKAAVIKMLQQGNPNLYNPQAVDQRIMRITNIDPSGLFNEQPAPQAPDPRLVAVQQKAQATQAQVQAQMQDSLRKAQVELAKLQDRAADRESKERIENMRIEIEKIRLMQEQASVQNDMDLEREKVGAELQADRERTKQEMEADAVTRIQDIQMKRRESDMDMARSREETRMQMQAEREKHEHDMQVQREKHAQQMELEREKHQMQLENERAIAQVKVEMAKKIAASKPKPAAKAKSSGSK